jgi:hypothetical protein
MLACMWPRLLLVLVVIAAGVSAQQPQPEPPNPVRAVYTKYEHLIPMRDGVKLFTSVYVPKTCTAPQQIQSSWFR